MKQAEKENALDEFEMLGQLHTHGEGMSFLNRSKNHTENAEVPLNQSGDFPKNCSQPYGRKSDQPGLIVKQDGISIEDIHVMQDNIIASKLAARLSTTQFDSHSQPSSSKQPYLPLEQPISPSQPLPQALVEKSNNPLLKMPHNNAGSMAHERRHAHAHAFTSTSAEYGQATSPGSPSDFDFLGDISPVLPLPTDSPDMTHLARHNSLESEDTGNLTVSCKAVHNSDENEMSWRTENKYEEMCRTSEAETSLKVPQLVGDQVSKTHRC